MENATVQIACIANGLADDLRKQCLEEYIGILKNVEKNYNRLQEEAADWNKNKSREKLDSWKFSFMMLLIILFFETYIVGKSLCYIVTGKQIGRAHV